MGHSAMNFFFLNVTMSLTTATGIVSLPAFGLSTLYFASRKKPSPIEIGLLAFNAAAFVTDLLVTTYRLINGSSDDSHEEEYRETEEEYWRRRNIPIMCGGQIRRMHERMMRQINRRPPPGDPFEEAMECYQHNGRRIPILPHETVDRTRRAESCYVDENDICSG